MSVWVCLDGLLTLCEWWWWWSWWISVTFTGPGSSQMVNTSQNMPYRLLLAGWEAQRFHGSQQLGEGDGRSLLLLNLGTDREGGGMVCQPIHFVEKRLSHISSPIGVWCVRSHIKEKTLLAQFCSSETRSERLICSVHQLSIIESSTFPISTEISSLLCKLVVKCWVLIFELWVLNKSWRHALQDSSIPQHRLRLSPEIYCYTLIKEGWSC